MAQLYCLTFPNGKLYIGVSSRSGVYRYAQHKSHAFRDVEKFKRIPLYVAWRKYGDPELIILYDGGLSDILFYERELINVIDCKIPNGYNVIDGGVASPMWNPDIAKRSGIKRKITMATDEFKQKVSKIRKGKTIPDEVKKKISQALKGKPKPEGFGLDIAMKRRVNGSYAVSDETRKKMSESAKARCKRKVS